jgi:hypothetical protein
MWRPESLAVLVRKLWRPRHRDASVRGASSPSCWLVHWPGFPDAFRIADAARADGFRIEMTRAVRASAERDVLAALENAVEDDLGQVGVVEHVTPAHHGLFSRLETELLHELRGLAPAALEAPFARAGAALPWRAGPAAPPAGVGSARAWWRPPLAVARAGRREYRSSHRAARSKGQR